MGKLVPLQKVQKIVEAATVREKRRAHEHTWNEDVHNPMVKLALEYSAHAKTIEAHNLYAPRGLSTLA